MSTQDIVETFIQQHRREAREEGREQGREQGRDEGRKLGQDEGRKLGRELGRDEGRELGWAEAILALYSERLGPPPAEISAIVQQTHDRGVLVGWLKLVATATADEVRRELLSISDPCHERGDKPGQARRRPRGP